MAKLNRITGKVFGATADPTDDPTLGPEIGQFGSALAGTYNGTSDVATIQSLPAWSNGFIDAVTPTNQYPPLPEMTGFGKVLSHQICYTLQQGMPEWDGATTYYKNNYCSYDGIIYKSIADENLGNPPYNGSEYWEVYGAITDYANKDLMNLTTLGNSRLQFAPFAINQGTVLNGENNTLGFVSGSAVQVNFTQPTLTSNGVLGGDAFAVTQSTSYSGTKAYMCFDNNSSTPEWHATAGLPQYVIFYNPNPLKVSALEIIPYTKGTAPSDNWVSGKVYGSNDNSTWTELATFTQASKTNPNVTVNSANEYYYHKVEFTATKYYRSASNPPSGYFVVMEQINITATYTLQAGTEFICNPCTITTADGRTYIDRASATYDVSTTADGNYFIFKDYSDGSLSLLNNLVISKTVPLNGTITGVLANSNGIVSGFSSTDYITTSSLFAPSTDPWEINVKVKTGNDVSSTTQTIFASTTTNYCPIACLITTGSLFRIYGYNADNNNSRVVNSTGTYTVLANTYYWIRVKYTGSAYTLEYSLDGETYIEDISEASSTATRSDGNISFGIRAVGNLTTYSDAFLGTIDFMQSSVEINNAVWWKGIIDNWLDISTTPANFYLNGTNLNNDFVLIGECTVSSGNVTAIKNRYFNACPYYRDLVESYVNGSSWYAIYSDGWCEQGASETITNSVTATAKTRNFLKNFKDTNYVVTYQPTTTFTSTLNTGYFVVKEKAVGSFTTTYNVSCNWQANGYVF